MCIYFNFNKRRIKLDLIIDEERAATAKNLIDPTNIGHIFRYLLDPTEEIATILIVSEGYELSQVVSPFMVHVDENPDIFKDMLDYNEYLTSLIDENVIKMIATPKDRIMFRGMEKYLVPIEEIDVDEAVECIMLPPIYWVKLLNKKWR